MGVVGEGGGRLDSLVGGEEVIAVVVGRGGEGMVEVVEERLRC